MKQSHTSRLKSPKVRQCRMVLPIPNLPRLPQSARGWIYSPNGQIPLGRDRFAAMAAPTDRYARSFTGSWFKVLSFSGRGSYYSGNRGSTYSIIPQGGD